MNTNSDGADADADADAAAARCCICLGPEHSCKNENDCRCAPLLFFCKTCSNCPDNSDKMACLNCIQRLMGEFTAQQQQQHEQEPENLPKLQAKSMSDLIFELEAITRAKVYFANAVLEKSYLQTMQIITMKAILFNIYCPQSFICMVSTLPYFTPSYGLVVRTLIAQRWFSSSCNATLLRQYKESFKKFENVCVKNIALMQRPNLLQSSTVLNNESQDCENYFTNLVETAGQNVQETPQNINTLIDDLFDEFNTGNNISRFERVHQNIQDTMVVPGEQEQPLHANSNPLQKSTKTGPCPMCRNHCTVINYTQSTAEKEQLEFLAKEIQDKRADHLENSWNILHAQRQACLFFDAQNKDKQCRCCEEFNRNLIEESHDSKKIDNYLYCSKILISVLTFAFFLIEDPFFMTISCLLIGFLAIFVNYFFVMKQLKKKLLFDGQIMYHCAARMVRLVDNVLKTFSTPGHFAQSIPNEFLLNDIKRNIDISVEVSGQRLLDPMSMIVELQHKTWQGALIDRTLQFIYSNDLLYKSNYSFLADGIVRLCQNIIHIGLVLLITCRSTTCEQLFNCFGSIVAKIATIGDKCRFRLQQKESFAKSVIYLKKEIADDEASDDESLWMFSSTVDRKRFLKLNQTKEKILFERIPKQNQNLCEEEDFLNAVERCKRKQNQTSIYRRLCNYLIVFNKAFCTFTQSMVQVGRFFREYPRKIAPIENYIKASNLILGSSGRTFADCLLYNALIFKLLISCAIAVSIRSDLLEILTKTLATFLRIEIILLILRLSFPLFLHEIVYCSDVSNSWAVSEVSNYCANFCFVNFINHSNKRKPTQIKIDAIRVGNNV